MASSGQTRVLELLTEARRARALRGRLSGAGRDTAEVDAALDGLYRDLGRVMVEAAEFDGGLLFESLRRPEQPDYELEDDEESWYTDDPEDEPSGPREVAPLFDPGDLASIPDPEFDDTTPVIPPLREYTDSDTPLDFVVATVAGCASAASSDPASPIAALRAPPDGVAWRADLAGLLGLLELPRSFVDADDLKTEATRLQWVTSELEPRLAGLPTDVQVAMLGLLGARAQHLRDRLDSDVVPRVLLDRLLRYRIDRHLGSVAALLPRPRPEYDAWDEDARRWWSLLHTGYSSPFTPAV